MGVTGKGHIKLLPKIDWHSEKPKGAQCGLDKRGR